MIKSNPWWRPAAFLLAVALATATAGNSHAAEQPDPAGGDAAPAAKPGGQPPAEGEAPAAKPGADAPPSEGEAAKPEGTPTEAPAGTPPTAAAPPASTAAPPPPPPAPIAAAAPAPQPLSPDAPASEPWTADTRFVGGLITVSAGAVFLFIGHYAFFRINDAVREDDIRDYRATVPAGKESYLRGESVCGHARAHIDTAEGAEEVVDRCDELKALEVVRWVFLPTGVIASAIGIWLIGTSDTVNDVERRAEEARRVRWNVGVGSDGAGASVSVAW